MHRNLLLRRRAHANDVKATLFFYASLQEVKEPEYAWDTFGIKQNGLSTITAGRWHSSSRHNTYATIYNSKLPVSTNLSFSAYLWPENVVGWGRAVGGAYGGSSNGASKKNIWFGHVDQRGVGGGHNFEFLDIPNIFYDHEEIFVTYNYEYFGNGQGRTVLFVNGIKVGETTKTDTSYDWTLDFNYFMVGCNGSSGTGDYGILGSVARFSCMSLLSDEQVLKLYQAGGNPYAVAKEYD